MIKYKVLLCFFLITAQMMQAQSIGDSPISLNQKERSIVMISANAASGRIPELKVALNDGLSAGITVSEAKEILVHVYAYAGFPRSLNALHMLMEVLEERKAKGIIDEMGKDASPLSSKNTMLQTGTENQTKLVGSKIAGGVYEFAPTIDRFLKEHLFGAIFSRDNLDWKTRELVTISALAAMEGVEPQLRSHYRVGMYNGLTKDQLSELTAIIETNISQQRGNIARQVLQSVIDQKPYLPNPTVNNEIFSAGQKIENNNFVGNAWLNQLILSDSSNSIQVGSVIFEPGSRTKWHYHPAGQILLVLEGVGYYQVKGSPKRVLHKGDAVKCPPNVPHWHGAAPNEKFVQVAVTDSKNGATVWMQVVSDDEYNNPPK